MKNEVIPILMCEYEDELMEKVKILQDLGIENLRVQLDVIDGIFAPVSLVRPDQLKREDFTGLIMEVQLMVDEPIDWLSGVYQMGARRVYGQIERMGSRDEFLREAKEYGLEVGWGVDLFTPVEELRDEELEQAEGVLLMAVKTGKSGQEFSLEVIPKIEHLRKRGYRGDICIDGGVNGETMTACLEAGANHLSMNSALWKAKEMRHTYGELVKKAQAYERK